MSAAADGRTDGATRPPSGDATRIRIEIQALRAVAVAAVLVYHVWPDLLPGGFVGVDVFFAISGFLITDHLIRERVRHGRISLSGFWARRIRRLLPAAFTVLLATVAIVVWVLPETARDAAYRQIGAAAVYALNWVLALDAVDYLAADAAPTPVQHFWTLSVEEQFYIGWPLLLVLGLLVAAGRAGRRIDVAALTAALAAAVVAVSLAASIVQTWLDPAFAYFDTGTRAWEFAAGALLAAVAARDPRWLARLGRGRPAVAATATGLGLIVVASVAFDASTPFPSAFAMLPVVGALLVIVGRDHEGRALGRALGLRPVQVVGDLSYSLYLWHWPLIVAATAVLGGPPGVVAGVGLIAASLLLAAATRRWIERPAIRASGVARRRVVAFLFAAIGALLVVALTAGLGIAHRQAQAEAADAVDVALDDDCFGAAAMLSGADCADRFAVPDEGITVPAILDTERWCLTDRTEAWVRCTLGDPSGTAGTVVLVGDSHAASLTVAADEWFAAQGWRVETYLRFGCSGLSSPDPGNPGITADDVEIADCATWSERVRAEVAARDDVDVILLTFYTAAYFPRGEGARQLLDTASIVDGVDELTATGIPLVLLVDPPLTLGDTPAERNVPACLARSSERVAPCSSPRELALPPYPELDAALADLPGIEVVDLTDAYCDAATCYTLVGGVPVYADHNHLSEAFARSLMPFLGPRVVAAAR